MNIKLFHYQMLCFCWNLIFLCVCCSAFISDHKLILTIHATFVQRDHEIVIIHFRETGIDLEIKLAQSYHNVNTGLM